MRSQGIIPYTSLDFTTERNDSFLWMFTLDRPFIFQEVTLKWHMLLIVLLSFLFCERILLYQDHKCKLHYHLSYDAQWMVGLCMWIIILVKKVKISRCIYHEDRVSNNWQNRELQNREFFSTEICICVIIIILRKIYSTKQCSNKILRTWY